MRELRSESIVVSHSTVPASSQNQRTAGARRGVHAREQALRGGDGALQALDDQAERVADLRLLLELVLEEAEDGGVEEGRVGRHWEGGRAVLLWCFVVCGWRDEALRMTLRIGWERVNVLGKLYSARFT